MTDELVAYLLDDLCPERRAEVERRLANDPQWQREFERLKECFATSDDPTKCVEEPPQDLVKRTCGCVARGTVIPNEASPVGDDKKRRGAAAAAFVAAPVGGGAGWSIADLTVAAGVLGVLGMLVFPALRESRDAARRLTCQNNLRTLSSGMYDFQENHGGWLPTIDPDAPAGLYSVALADDVGFDRRELRSMLVCPESELADKIARGETVIYIPTYAEVERLEGAERAKLLSGLSGIYAYRVGYQDDESNYHQVKYTGGPAQPMLADPPRPATLGLRSSNHDGGGQNVAYQQMCVKFQDNCDLAVSLDPIFLNMQGQHAAGCNKDDIVMLRGNAAPLSPTPIPFLQPVGSFSADGE